MTFIFFKMVIWLLHHQQAIIYPQFNCHKPIGAVVQLDQFLNQLNAIVWGKKLPGLANLGLAVDLVCLKNLYPLVN